MNPARRFARAHRNICRRKIRFPSSRIHKNQLIRNICSALIQHSRNQRKMAWRKRLFSCYNLHRQRVIEGGSTPNLEYRDSLSDSLGWELLCSPAPFIFRKRRISIFKRSSVWRGFTLVFSLLLAISLMAGSILETYRASVDAFFNTRSQLTVTEVDETGEAWSYVSKFKTAKEAFEGLKEFAIRESRKRLRCSRMMATRFR